MTEPQGLPPGAGKGRLLSALHAASPQRRARLLMDFLQEQLGPRLGMEPAEIGPRDNLMELGVDSIKAVELKGLLEHELGLELNSSLAFDQPNLEALTGFLLEAAQLKAPGTASPPVPPAPPPSSGTEEALSEELLAELLAAELQALKNPS
ncbi:acyl carrier protein [Stigmatella aurantiaca]|uniref:MtaE n=1 Tax=Stigmatella aurantiaca (strain DW4/3-1) TaxID=378806 RepID=Q096B8_STIAD|nr:acyl carrier protein [Stigmatella aurantiaca]ADO69490.1 MtaE protein [Stigmatella aurantiaca DW4/3-1]EAU67623.1 MtaE [Stigmatella aurantiaca DW4/3-1]